MLKKITSLSEVNQLSVDDVMVLDENSKRYTIKSINHEFIRMIHVDGMVQMKILPFERLVKEGWQVVEKNL